MNEVSVEFDTPWKKAIEQFFEQLMKMLRPKAHAKMNWMLTLPLELEQKLVSEILEDEAVQEVEYLSKTERWSIESGLLQGMQQGVLQQARDAVLQVLEVKFQTAPPEMAEADRQIEDTALLNDLLKKAVLTASLEEFRQAMAN